MSFFLVYIFSFISFFSRYGGDARCLAPFPLFFRPPLSSQDPPPVLHTAFNFLNDVSRLVSSRVCREMHPRNERKREREREIVLSQDIFYGHVSMSGPFFYKKKDRVTQISYIQVFLRDTKNNNFSLSLSLQPSSRSHVKFGSQT